MLHALTYQTAHKGQFVKVHPAHDVFMMGVQYATITQKRKEFAYIHPSGMLGRKMRLRLRVPYDFLLTP